MTVINVNGERSSFNHLEIWGQTDSGNCAYIRYRTGKLEIRLADDWSSEHKANFIEESDAHTVFTRELDEELQYSELKRRYSNWDDFLSEEPYSISPAQF